jgi:AraC-like DNA-binding protein
MHEPRVGSSIEAHQSLSCSGGFGRCQEVSGSLSRLQSHPALIRLFFAYGIAMNGSPAIQDPVILRRLLRAKDRMDFAPHEAWTVRRLARVSAISTAHFARSFKQAFGVPPHRYLLTRRIERATALLRDTDLSVTDIAFRTGWTSLGSFGRTLRDVTGDNPGVIRVGSRIAAPDLTRVPACFLSAAQRPDLTIAVLEKRRRSVRGINGSGSNQEEIR